MYNTVVIPDTILSRFMDLSEWRKLGGNGPRERPSSSSSAPSCKQRNVSKHCFTARCSPLHPTVAIFSIRRYLHTAVRSSAKSSSANPRWTNECLVCPEYTERIRRWIVSRRAICILIRRGRPSPARIQTAIAESFNSEN